MNVSLSSNTRERHAKCTYKERKEHLDPFDELHRRQHDNARELDEREEMHAHGGDEAQVDVVGLVFGRDEKQLHAVDELQVGFFLNPKQCLMKRCAVVLLLFKCQIVSNEEMRCRFASF